MKQVINIRTVLIASGAAFLAGLILLPAIASAQGEEVSSAIRRYKDREASTGYYEK